MIQELTGLYHEHANTDNAKWMHNYMKGQFDFFGIKTPERKILHAIIYSTYGMPSPQETPQLIKQLWAKPEREYQLFAMELLLKTHKQWTIDFIDLFEWMILHKSWWDTVDLIASNMVGKYFVRFPDHRLEKIELWTNGNNMWLQRTAILFQLKYKEKTDVDLLFALIQQHASSKEFFIRKAIGWSLRQYAKTNAESVRQFVANNSLSPLSQREALKHIG